MSNPREFTDRLIEACEEGALSWEDLARECMSAMSEHDVSEMSALPEWFPEWFEDEEEEDEEEEEEEEPQEPEDGDYILSDCGPLGAGTLVSEVGNPRALGTFGGLGSVSGDHNALEFIRGRMQSEQFWPNVWRQDDHGGVSLIEDFDPLAE